MKRFPLLVAASALLMSLSACQPAPDDTQQSSVIKVTNVTLNVTEKTLNGGETLQLVATVLPENATNKSVRFLSSKQSVASVDKDGLVTALSAGVSNISVITNDGNHFAQCKITVNSGGVTPVTPTPVDPVTPDPVVPDPEPEPDPVDPHIDDETTHPVTIQDNTVLHCWNWSMNTIKNNLNDIANAGFKTVQLSPMQPQKDYSGGRWNDQWWKLYQPLGFSIAQNNQNILGTKEELRSMCAEAETKGIKVIVDVVANHLAGGTDKSFDWNVQYFEPEIYQQNLIHQLGDKTKEPASVYNANSEYLIKGAIGGFPDLQTESPIVQNRVLSLLKEYIDVGVDGFRFDAAKHIETPDDGDLASNFWPTVINGATEYAHSKNLPTPYYYGEILTTPGTRRDFDWYTKYMSVTDNEEGTKVIEAIEKKSAAPLSYSGYRTALDANKLMLWGESHDTYANDWGSTKDSKAEDVNKAYCIQASRKDASSLYFARPIKINDPWQRNDMGTIGSYDFKNIEIKAANNFHNKLMFSQETIHISNGCYVNERGTKGIAIIGVSNEDSQVTIELKNIESGSYINLVNNQTVNISNKKVMLTLYNGVAFLIRNDI